ncbi:glycosyltransferase family 4 protein [Actinomyces faecalis]|uniref:glycosyltransferase family 4 protein n=1 Tax=Actinomyces faecalis TaxID=2722820 RepID=UPI001FD21AE1|nr:glycosyltransferase family 1 protein [Actinomyces faecalis]
MDAQQPALPRPDGPRIVMVVEQLWQPVPGGSGTYIRELATALASQGTQLAGLAARHPDQPSPTQLGLPRSMAVARSPLPRTALYEAWNHLGYPRAEHLVPGADLVHATTWAVPGTRLPLAVTVHDLAFLRSPEHFTRHGDSYFRRCLERTRALADVIIVPSQATADDCIAAGIEARHLEVVPHGVRRRALPSGAISAFRSVHGLTNEYVLWTGTREPRKNLEGLLQAFEILAPDHPDLDLVLVGPVGWGEDSSSRPLPPALTGRVHVLGRLSDDDLAAAYSGARAFCFPSHWEGFGLPVLEAMAYGTPVVTSRGTCMEEVCGDVGLLASPDSPQEIAGQLAVAVGAEHDTLAEAGRTRAGDFTWQACAAAHTAVYEALVGGLR